MDKDLISSESTEESKEFDFKEREDCCAFTVYTVERGTNTPMNIVNESCETIRAAPENVVAGTNGEIEVVASEVEEPGRDAE